MRIITFKDGHKIKTKLSVDETISRMKRLDTLRVLVEPYVDDSNIIAERIYRRVRKAYDNEVFTGVIRLSSYEKDWLSYLLESDYISDKEVNCINFYLRH